MSGIIGHSTYAVLAMKSAEARKLPITPVIKRHFSSYLAGAYLGCDIQTMPAAICLDTGENVGYGSSPLEESPITGGPVLAFKLKAGNRDWTPKFVNETFYGRAHLILGWRKQQEELKIPLSKLFDYLADVVGDAIEIYGPGERPLAYVLGWMTHVAGDGLIKSVIDGINLHLLDGKYTIKNRPIQDLISFNEIGRKELGLNWPALLDDLATVPVEPVQLHYMRCAEVQGRLGAHFPGGWAPHYAELMKMVMTENRRYQRIRNSRLIQQLSLKESSNGTLECAPELSKATGGMTYQEMIEAAEKADFRQALWQMGEIIADYFERVIDRQDLLQDLPASDGPTWQELTNRWMK